MKDYAEVVGGICRVAGEWGNGTIVSLGLPLESGANPVPDER
ncbi:MAG: hypothetical protein O3A47_01290 [Chloroflexi bacterium]|nr:hypothetical protein [Chloroflexota bacterium]